MTLPFITKFIYTSQLPYNLYLHEVYFDLFCSFEFINVILPKKYFFISNIYIDKYVFLFVESQTLVI